MKKKWEAQESLPIEELREITNEEREYEAVIEAVLFTMGNSVEVRQLAAAIGQDEETARSAVKRLMKQYEAGRKGMQIIELENSYQMCTRPEYYENLIRVAATPKKQVLTDVVLETLSIIAYKQPVTKMEIEKIRGVKSDHAVNWWNTTWYTRWAASTLRAAQHCLLQRRSSFAGSESARLRTFPLRTPKPLPRSAWRWRRN